MRVAAQPGSLTAHKGRLLYRWRSCRLFVSCLVDQPGPSTVWVKGRVGRIPVRGRLAAMADAERRVLVV
jgi:hypothetical protein